MFERLHALNRTAPGSASPLIEAFDRQDETFATAFEILREAITQRAFPAASVAVTHRGVLVALKALGTLRYDEGAAPLRQAQGRLLARASREGGGFAFASATTLFDLASLTKVVATTTVAMLLYERGLLDLEAPVAVIVPEFTSEAARDPRRHEVTLRMLLAHSSGFPAYEKLFLKAHTREELLSAVFTMPLAADPVSRAVYSDIGFMLLGVALERIVDESLDRFCQREVFARLGMTSTTYNPPESIRAAIPPTQDDRTFRKRVIQGEVQDENAFVLGGIAPHAGLFSTAGDLAKIAHTMLNAGRSIFRPETIALFTRREPAPAGTSRALGWDTPSAASQSGKYFSQNSYGHLGYTGTSIWIDSIREVSITLLTNRTWPDCSDQRIKVIRPRFYDAVIEALESA